jgi:multidrug efflux pump subunit AcrB
MDQLLSWLSEYTLFFSTAAGASILLMIVSLAATPWLVASLPSDYLQPKALDSRPTGLFRALILTFRNIVGLILVILGLILLVTPGPGIVVLLVGISMAEFPGKQRLFISIAIQPKVFTSLNWMRTRRGKTPFEYPDTTL